MGLAYLGYGTTTVVSVAPYQLFAITNCVTLAGGTFTVEGSTIDNFTSVVFRIVGVEQYLSGCK